MAQKFGYNGKELSEELGLNTYDFGARNYSPDIARWSNIDALADATGQIHNTPYAYAMNNPTVFDDPDGNCPPGIDCTSILIGLATQNGNGVAAHTLGVAQGLTNTVTGVVDAVSNPGQTLQGMANMAVGGIANGNSATMLSLDSVLGTDSFGTSMAMGEAISNSADALVNGNGIERGTVIGEVIGAVLGTKGANATLKGASTVLKANKTTKVFRTFGGDAGPAGKSFTPVNPNSVSNFRDAAGLPSGGAFGKNTARFIIEGTVKEKNILLRRKAIPMDGNRGGLPEIVVKDATKVKIKRVSGVNPEF